MKKLLSILLAAVMLLGTAACHTSNVAPEPNDIVQAVGNEAAISEAVPEPSPQPAAPTSDELTREQASEIIFAAAAKYNAGITAEAVTQGLPENGGAATCAEVLAMLSNAFGDFPEPTGENSRIMPEPAVYSDLPDWAAPAVANLNKGGLLVGTEDGLLKGDEAITAAELDTYLRRIYTLYGTRPEDDFYTYANREDLALDYDKTGRKSGTDEALKKIYDDVIGGKWEAGTPERQIQNLYETANDTAARNKAGTTPLKPYLDAIAAAKNLDGLNDVQIMLAKDLAFFPFNGYRIQADFHGNSANAIMLTSTIQTGQSIIGNTAEIKSMTAYYESILELAGVENAKATAKAASDMVMKFSESYPGLSLEMSRILAKDILEAVKCYTAEEAKQLAIGPDVTTLFDAAGVQPSPKTYNIQYHDGVTLETLRDYYTEENLEAFKAYIQVKLLDTFAGALGEDLAEAKAVYDGKEITGDGAAKNMKDDIIEYASGYFSDKFAEIYFPQSSRDELKAFVATFIENYHGRIAAADWLSDSAKATAQKKLDNMTVSIAAPDTPMDYLSHVGYKSPAEGGGYFSNIIAYRRGHLAYVADRLLSDEPVFNMDAYGFNAYVNPTGRQIVFLAGYLLPPSFTPGGVPEVNLAKIGETIAHEITHIFDNNGAGYDENGKISRWWSEADAENFAKLCKKVEDFYDGYEVAPGITTNGAITINENIADLGGLSCALEALEKTVENPDYKLFFTAFAEQFCRPLRDREDLLEDTRDNHAPLKARVNKTVQTCEQFYEAFDVKPGDGMYIAPENRVKVW